MAIEFIDGFDHYNNATNLARKWDVGSNMTGVVTGRYGTGNAMTIGTFTDVKTLPAVATRVVGFAYFTVWSSTSSINIVSFRDSGTVQVDVRTTNAGVVTVTRNGTVLATASVTLTQSVWHFIEFKATIGSSGSYELRIDGVNVASATGVNTQATANPTTNQVCLQHGGTVNGTYQYDDLYVLNTSGSANNNFLGECRIFTSLPTGDDASFKAWTPSTGTSHFANVDDNPPNDDTDFNSSSTVGQIDLFTFPSISPAGSIACVQTVLTARKDDAGTRQICEECRSGSTNYDGANTFTMQSAYFMYCEIREVDPSTSAAWTLSGLNAAEFGARVIA